MTEHEVRRRRVPAMTPEQRRAALIEATVPLLRAHGVAVSTRQIADAAGVAEGTIFGVFPDKASLLRAALISAFDPAPALAAISAVDTDADLRTRLVAVVDLLRPRFADNVALLMSVRASHAAPGAPPPPPREEGQDLRTQLTESRRQIVAALAALIEPDRALLRRDPQTVARLLLMWTMSGMHGGFEFGALANMDSAELVSLLLDGLLVGPSSAAVPAGSPPKTASATAAEPAGNPPKIASATADPTGDSA